MRNVLAALSRQETGRYVERLVAGSPLAHRLLRRYVPGPDAAAAVRATAALAAEGLPVTIEYLGEPDAFGRDPRAPRRTDGPEAVRRRAEHTVAEYLRLLDRLAARGLARGADLTVDAGALGLPADERRALDAAARLCAAARDAGATVTLDLAEERVPAGRLIALHAELGREHPDAGVTVPACLRAAEEHCRLLTDRRVRLRKGLPGAAARDGAALAYRTGHGIDRSFVRCLRVLMAGRGHVAVATHDGRMLEIASVLATLNEREPGDCEFQLPYGVRAAEQRRLRGLGAAVRVHVPYGTAWYGYLLRRL